MFVTAFAAAVLTTTPVIATDTPVPAPAPKAAPAAANPRVCFVDQVTGSHLRRKTCKTLAQWRALGIDPLEKR
jgi:hypothetical protein